MILNREVIKDYYTSQSGVGKAGTSEDKDAATIHVLLSEQDRPKEQPPVPGVAENPSQKQAMSPSMHEETGDYYALLYFSADSLARLKQDVSVQLSHGFVSTLDTVSALLWSSYEMGNQKEKRKPSSTMLTAVNIRHRVSPPIADDYIGNAVIAAYSQAPVLNLKDGAFHLSALAKTASTIRQELTKHDQAYIHGLVQTISTKASTPHWVTTQGRPFDLMSTSWALQGAYDFKWHPLMGRCEAVRIQPAKVTFEYACILPKMPDGGLEVAFALRSDIYEGLKGQKDLLLNKYAEWRG